MQDLKTKEVPVRDLPERKSQHQDAVTEEVMAQVQWLKPEQAAEIEFVERTPYGWGDEKSDVVKRGVRKINGGVTT